VDKLTPLTPLLIRSAIIITSLCDPHLLFVFLVSTGGRSNSFWSPLWIHHNLVECCYAFCPSRYFCLFWCFARNNLPRHFILVTSLNPFHIILFAYLVTTVTTKTNISTFHLRNPIAFHDLRHFLEAFLRLISIFTCFQRLFGRVMYFLLKILPLVDDFL